MSVITQFYTSKISTKFPDLHFISDNQSHTQKAGNHDLSLSVVPCSSFNSSLNYSGKMI